MGDLVTLYFMIFAKTPLKKTAAFAIISNAEEEEVEKFFESMAIFSVLSQLMVLDAMTSKQS